jgi:hypothetical protein
MSLLSSLWGASMAAMAMKWQAKAKTKPMTIIGINAFIFTGQSPPSFISIANYLPICNTIYILIYTIYI